MITLEEHNLAMTSALDEAAQIAGAYIRRAMCLSPNGYELERTYGYMVKYCSDAIYSITNKDRK